MDLVQDASHQLEDFQIPPIDNFAESAPSW